MENNCRNPKRIRGVIVLLASMFLLAGCNRAPAPVKQAVAVTISKVTSQTTPIQLEAVGSVQPYNSVTVMPLVTGRVMSLHFQQGQEVKAGDILITIDPAPFKQKLAQAQALLNHDVSQSTFNNSSANRYNELFRIGGISRQDYEEVNTSAATQAATVQQSQAAAAAAQIDLDNCYIRSPINGRTGAFLANIGSLAITNQTQLVVINQLEPIFVQFSIPEKYLAKITTAQKEHPPTVTAAITDQNITIADGVLTFIDNTVDSSGTIQMKAQFPNTSHQLWPGQFIRVTINLGEQPNAIIVPSSAIMDGQQGKYAFIVKDDQTVEVRKVTIDREVDNITVVAQGLASGETVVTDGQVNLRPGSAIVIKESDQTPVVTQQGGDSK